jgi:hypothetical protein
MTIIIGPGITITGGINVDAGIGAPLPGGVYTLEVGTKAPVLGAGAQSPFPAVGWTSIVSATADDANTNVSLPFAWNYNNTGYTSFFPNSNYYVTFGSGSNQFNSLSASSPALNKIYFAGADNSWQRVSSVTSSTNYTRLRWEGTSSTSGTPGAPNMVYELTFFNPSLTGGNPWLELLVGVQARGNNNATVISGLYSATAKLTGGDLGPSNRGVTANQSYVMVGDSTGTNWTVYTGYNVGGTGY